MEMKDYFGKMPETHPWRLLYERVEAVAAELAGVTGRDLGPPLEELEADTGAAPDPEGGPVVTEPVAPAGADS